MERTETYYTECANCCFSITENDVQDENGCVFGRLAKYIARGKAEKKEEESTYTISTICKAKHTDDWAKLYDDPVEVVRQQMVFSCDAIVYCLKEDDAKHKIVKTTKSLLSQQQIKPKNLLLILGRDNDINYPQFYSEIDSLIGGVFQFKIIRMLENIETEMTLIDKATKKITSQYLLCVKAGVSIPNNLLKTCDKWINEDLRQISMIKIGEEAYILQSLLYKIFNGNVDKSILEKIESAASKQNAESMVIKWIE